MLRHRGHCAPGPSLLSLSLRLIAFPTVSRQNRPRALSFSFLSPSLFFSLSLSLSFWRRSSARSLLFRGQGRASLLYFVRRYAPCNRITDATCNGNNFESYRNRNFFLSFSLFVVFITVYYEFSFFLSPWRKKSESIRIKTPRFDLY